jgi:hypothetical protein
LTAAPVTVTGMNASPLSLAVAESGDLVVPSEHLDHLPPGTPVQVRITQLQPGVASTRVATAAAVAVAFGAAVVAVMAAHANAWRWTGFQDNDSLWSWLTLLFQPVAVAVLTVRLVLGDRWSSRSWLLGLGGALILGVVGIGGYAGRWAWTGFGGEQLWDWLHLLLLPLVLVLLPEWVRSGRRFDRRHWTVAAATGAAFGVVVWGGYRWGWAWTGFTGNTFHDWLSLLIAPFLLPLACKTIHAHQGGRATVDVASGPAAPPSPSAMRTAAAIASAAAAGARA